MNRRYSVYPENSDTENNSIPVNGNYTEENTGARPDGMTRRFTMPESTRNAPREWESTGAGQGDNAGSAPEYPAAGQGYSAGYTGGSAPEYPAAGQGYCAGYTGGSVPEYPVNGQEYGTGRQEGPAEQYGAAEQGYYAGGSGDAAPGYGAGAEPEYTFREAEDGTNGYFAGGNVAPYAKEEYTGSRQDAGRKSRIFAKGEWKELLGFAAGQEEAEEERPGNGKKSIFKKRRRKPSFVLTVAVNSMRLLLLIILLLGLSGAGAVVGIAKAYVDAAPVLDLEVLDSQAETSFIYDAEGNEICRWRGVENRVKVDIRSMPMMLRYAFVAVEDARFYSHNGVDLKRIVGAFITNLTTGSNQGGSTITQQLIKNTLLSSEQSYKRKIQEAYLAMQLENKYTKDQILQCYLNTIYLGEDYYGVETAATGYFGKSDLFSLTLRECAMLAGMTRNPYYYNCRRNYWLRHSEETDYRKITDDRTDYVLRCMYENGFISAADYYAALDPATANVLEKAPDSESMYAYPHYVEYAMRDVIRALLELNGLEDTAANRNRMDNELRTGGYHVWLALDTGIQKTVEETLRDFKDYPALRDPEDKIYRARNSDGTYEEIIQPQAAAVVMDYRTGEVKAIVGSRETPTRRKTLNRAADMNMPVGSAIKPISVYAPAIEKGAGGGTVLYNMPVPIQGWLNEKQEDSWPTNYGGSSYAGPETLRTALKKSDNTAAAYAMMNIVYVEDSVGFLRKLGVSQSRISATPFGVTLGSSGITPFEMAVAYSCLANGGIYQRPITFLGLFKEDENGNRVNIWDSHQKQTMRKVFSPSTAWLTVDILKDAVKSGTATKAAIKGQTVAGKTGTNSDQKGVFFAGMTGWYCAAVWIGHDNYKALSSKTTGGNSAALLWKAFMEKIHKDKNLENRDIMNGTAQDYGLVKVEVCSVSGELATDACRHDAMGYKTVSDYWRAGTQPTEYCRMHRTVELCRESGQVASPYCPDTETQSVIVIPAGHALERFRNTRYAGVLEDYLGEYALQDPYGTLSSCTLHASYTSPYTPAGSADEWRLRDARSLLEKAWQRMQGMDVGSSSYAALYYAAENMENVLNASPDNSTLTVAMTQLTQALAMYE